MVILNPKFYHQIESVFGLTSRISIGFFFGELSKSIFALGLDYLTNISIVSNLF